MHGHQHRLIFPSKCHPFGQKFGQSFYELRAAAQRLDQARRSIELATRSHDIIQDRYREGLTILPELLDAETALTRARLREVAARRDVLVARATLDLATGNL